MINPLKIRFSGINSEKKILSVNDYLAERGITKDAIEVANSKSNPIEEFLERYGVNEDALRTVEGRKGALLKHRLFARMILLCALTAPMVIIPFWLMWALSPGNLKHYSERMQLALLGILGADVLGLCFVVTRNLFPQGEGLLQGDDNLDEDSPEDDE